MHWILPLAALTLTACTSSLYHNGRKAATVSPLHRGSMKPDTGEVIVEPPQNVVDAATTVAIRVVEKAPEIAGKVIDSFAARTPQEQ